MASQWDLISATKLNTFKACAYKYYLRYKLKIKEPTNEHMQRGSAAHKVLETIFGAEKCPIDVSKGFIELQFVSHMETVFQEVWDSPSFPFLRGRDEMRQETLDALDLFVRAFSRKFIKIYKKYPYKGVAYAWKLARPDLSEQELKNEKFLAFVDTINEDRDTGEITITDHKTSSPFGSGYNEEYMTQIVFYAYLYELITGKKVRFGEISYVLYLERARFEITPQQLDELAKLIEDFEKITVSSNPLDYPKNTSYHFCKKFCFYGENKSPETGEVYCDRKPTSLPGPSTSANRHTIDDGPSQPSTDSDTVNQSPAQTGSD